jgi:hypothetical protein
VPPLKTGLLPVEKAVFHVECLRVFADAGETKKKVVEAFFDGNTPVLPCFATFLMASFLAIHVGRRRQRNAEYFGVPDAARSRAAVSVKTT